LPNDLLPPNLGNVTGALSVRGHRATMQMNYFDYLGRDWSASGESFRRLGLRYVLSREPLPGLRELAPQGDVHLYERPSPLGIFYFVDQTLPPVPARIDAIAWHDNSMELTLAEGQSGRLVFAQPRYPGWHVGIDGRHAKLEAADIFLAVDVPPGGRHLEFYYRPFWLWPSIALALLAAAVLVGAAANCWRESAKRQRLA